MITTQEPVGWIDSRMDVCMRVCMHALTPHIIVTERTVVDSWLSPHAIGGVLGLEVPEIIQTRALRMQRIQMSVDWNKQNALNEMRINLQYRHARSRRLVRRNGRHATP